MFEGLKRIWQQAKKNVKEAEEFAKDDGVIKMPPAVFENEHETTPVNLSVVPLTKALNIGCPSPSFGDDEPSTPIDTEIAALIAEMNRVGIETTCSCQGHEDGEAYISIRLGEGTTYNHRKDVFGPGQDELTLRWRRR